MTQGKRNGFTLVELLVVVVLGGLVLAAALQVLITNQRSYSRQQAQVQGQQVTRAALDVLSGELREISAGDGDILAMTNDSLTIRVMRGFGLTCRVDASGTPTLTVLEMAGSFESNDTTFVFSDRDDNTTSDDAWLQARITNSTADTCQGQTANELRFQKKDPLVTGEINVFRDTMTHVLVGAPVRKFSQYTYGVFSSGGETFLGRREAGVSSQAVPLIGPVASSGGVSFVYLKDDGSAALTNTEVRQIVVTIISATGNEIADTLQTRIYTRN